jgi:hypothetical protein
MSAACAAPAIIKPAIIVVPSNSFIVTSHLSFGAALPTTRIYRACMHERVIHTDDRPRFAGVLWSISNNFTSNIFGT